MQSGHGIEWVASAAGVASLSLVPGTAVADVTGWEHTGLVVQSVALGLALAGLCYQLCK